jgi:hypothetical protein
VIFHGRQKQGSEPGTPTENKPSMENQAPENKSKETPAVKANPEKVIPADNKVTDSKSDETAPEKGEDNPKENKPADNKVTDSKLDRAAPEKEEDKPNEDQPIENPVAGETPTEDTIVEIGDQNIAVVPEPTTSNSNNSDSSIIITVLRVAQIVGFIVVGLVLATLVVLLFIWCSQPLWWPCCLKRKHKKQEMKQNQNSEHDPANGASFSNFKLIKFFLTLPIDRETLPTTPAPPQQTPPSTTHQTNTAPPQQNPPSTIQQNSTAPKPPKVPTITNPVAPTTPGNAQTTLVPPAHQASASSGGSSKTSGKTSSTKKSSHSTKVSSQNNNAVAAPTLKPTPSPSKPPPPQVPSNTSAPNPAPVPVPAPSKPQPPVPNNAPAQVPAPTKPPPQVLNKVPSPVPIPVPLGVPSPAPPALPIPAPSPARVPSAAPNTAIVPPQKPQDIHATDGATDIWSSSEDNYSNSSRDSSSLNNSIGRMSGYRYLSHSRRRSVPGTFPDSR